MPEAALLTIFTAPKPFTGLFGVIQRNAIESWTKLSPMPHIIIFGDDEGIGQAASEFGAEHVPSVATTEQGTPLLSDVFDRAQLLATTPIMAFVNADIILTSESMEAAHSAADWAERFMLVARRFDIDLPGRFDFANPQWERDIKTLARTGRLRSDGAIDWFVFRRDQLRDLPPFAIGRTSYDNWLLWKTEDCGYPVVDATAFVPLLHQRHDYSHAGGAMAVWAGPEAQNNRKLAGHWSHFHKISHARWVMTEAGELVPARALRYRLARPKRLVGHLLRFTRDARTLMEYGRDRTKVGRGGVS